MSASFDFYEELVVRHRRSAAPALVVPPVDAQRLERDVAGMRAAIHGEAEEHARRKTGCRRRGNPAPGGTEHTVADDRMMAPPLREPDHFGRMIVALDPAHDAIALIVQPLGREHLIGLVQRVLANLLERANELVETRLAEAAHG